MGRGGKAAASPRRAREPQAVRCVHTGSTVQLVHRALSQVAVGCRCIFCVYLPSGHVYSVYIRPVLPYSPAPSHRGILREGWTLPRYRENRRSARPVEAPTCRFAGRGCPADVHLRPRAEEAGHTSSTRLLQLADVEQLPRAKNEIWYQGSETPRSGRRVTRVVSRAA